MVYWSIKLNELDMKDNGKEIKGKGKVRWKLEVGYLMVFSKTIKNGMEVSKLIITYMREYGKMGFFLPEKRKELIQVK